MSWLPLLQITVYGPKSMVCTSDALAVGGWFGKRVNYHCDYENGSETLEYVTFA